MQEAGKYEAKPREKLVNRNKPLYGKDDGISKKLF